MSGVTAATNEAITSLYDFSGFNKLAAGFKLLRVIPTPLPTSIVEAEPA